MAFDLDAFKEDLKLGIDLGLSVLASVPLDEVGTAKGEAYTEALKDVLESIESGEYDAEVLR